MVRNQDGRAPWAIVADVTFTNNIVRNVASGISILGRDDNWPSQQTQRLHIRNVLFHDVGGSRWGGGGQLFQIVENATDVVIEHVTSMHTGNLVTASGAPTTNLTFRNNLVRHNEYGVMGSGMAFGQASLDWYFPYAEFWGNVLIGGPPGRYSWDNALPQLVDEIGLVDVTADDYRIRDDSAYRRSASGGTDPGVDFAELHAVTYGAYTGVWEEGGRGALTIARGRARRFGCGTPRVLAWSFARPARGVPRKSCSFPRGRDRDAWTPRP